MRNYAKKQMIAILRIVHSGVALNFIVLGRAMRRNQGGIYDRAGLENQDLGRQLGVDGGQK
jgi:hypothetical protein